MNRITAILIVAALATGSWFAYKHYSHPGSAEVQNVSSEKQSEEKGEARGMAALFGKMRNNPATGTMALEDYYQARADAKYFAAQGKRGALNLQWEEMGPDNQGGRTRAFLIDKDDPNHMFAGGVSGGLWVSKNAGASWNKVPGTDDFENMNVSCITQAHNGNIYFGTGEVFGFFNTANVTGATGFPGGGVWMSTDHGLTWTNITPAATTNSITSAWSFVNDIEAGKGDKSDFVYAGIKGGSGIKGLQVLNINTNVFENGPVGTGSAAGAEVKDIEVATNGAVHATIGNKYYRMNPGESILTPMSGSFNTGNRMEIAVAPSDPNVVYITSVQDQDLSGVWRTTDGGASFTQLAGVTNTSSTWRPITQGVYALAAAVHPTNPDMFYMGGLDVYRYTPDDGFTRISKWTDAITSPLYVHADIHNFIFRTDDPNNMNRMYVVSDGGINYTPNAAASEVTWATRNAGYITTQFYSACARDYSGDLLGGTQDNGNWLIDFYGNTTRWGQMVKGGDGGDVAASTINPNIIFAEYTYGDLDRSSNNGASFSSMLDNRIDANDDNTPDPGAPFIAQFELWENPADDNPLTQSKFFLGTINNVWMTQEALDLTKTPTWFKLVDNTSYTSSTLGSGADVSAIEVAADGKTVFVGTENGRVFRISGLNSVLSYPATGTFKAGDFGISVKMIKDFGGSRFVTSIDVNESNDDHVVVTLGNYGQPDHVYESTNATDSLVTFTNIAPITSGLPAMPVYACLIDKQNPNHIVIGTEVGVYSTSDGGSNWTIEDDGMPRCPVLKLYRHKLNDPNVSTGYVENVILAATYGRGLFRTRSLSFTGTEARPRYIGSRTIELFPNPASDQTTVGVVLTQPTDVKLDVMSLDGKVLQTVSYKNQPAGNLRLVLETRNLVAGTYLVSATGKNLNATNKMVVVR